MLFTPSDNAKDTQKLYVMATFNALSGTEMSPLARLMRRKKLVPAKLRAGCPENGGQGAPKWWAGCPKMAGRRAGCPEMAGRRAGCPESGGQVIENATCQAQQHYAQFFPAPTLPKISGLFSDGVGVPEAGRGTTVYPEKTRNRGTP